MEQQQHTLQLSPGIHLTRLAVMLTMFGIFAAITIYTSSPPPVYPFETEQAEVQAVREAVKPVPVEVLFTRQQETILKSLGDASADEWAGKYVYTDERGVETYLAWSPQHGFALWHTDGVSGGSEFDFGFAMIGGGRLRLLSQLTQTQMGAHPFVNVKWGQRRYLVPADSMINFCHAVSSGQTDGLKQFPSKGGHGDIASPPGMPEVPDEYRVFLHRSRFLQ